MHLRRHRHLLDVLPCVQVIAQVILRNDTRYRMAAAYLKGQVAPAPDEDSFGLDEHLRKAATASSDEQAAQEDSREESAEQQLHGSDDPVPLASPETTGQAGRLPRRPQVLFLLRLVKSVCQYLYTRETHVANQICYIGMTVFSAIQIDNMRVQSVVIDDTLWVGVILRTVPWRQVDVRGLISLQRGVSLQSKIPKK
ncbi:hypothetical protein AURANDRAFT_68557 [Aureococcus anophagefferens]|uniref:Uncharacterized protein n=1 Tax=Aureococcus anophagefferens TaxID=44056 RepID=F0YQ11_AURAN|nr:hypothetical protein AURANDRAFT_68557 [Aureococcus anophagefferens]EGB02799.1 hypothetical protein AURANDRAFT_68557 [Aureococcus anophagefferens]|eukprot:XP_009042505.1 hypothetical protein AURANDRAFT_68557 [Aureococcus anophagefferens]